MILRRLGSKQRIAEKIIKYFPKHKIYIEPFFGAGGMFFNKPKAKYNIVNDIDSDVYNLFMVVMNQKEELEKAFYQMPIHSDLLNYWKKNEETEPIKKALRFLFLSNMTYLGVGGAIRCNVGNDKKILLSEIDKIFDFLFEVKFINEDFKRFIEKYISFRGTSEQDSAFIYCDPPYLNTIDNYSNSFTEQDSTDLFNTLQETGCKWAMSEFDNPFIIQQAKERKLNIITIGERQNLKNVRSEILITNYKLQITKSLFDDCK